MHYADINKIEALYLYRDVSSSVKNIVNLKASRASYERGFFNVACKLN